MEHRELEHRESTLLAKEQIPELYICSFLRKIEPVKCLSWINKEFQLELFLSLRNSVVFSP